MSKTLREYDALAEFEAVAKLQADAGKLDEEFQRLTRKLFTLPSGRQWLRAAMARYNFNGSVFAAEDGMDPAKAAYRDGMRALLSDVLNASFARETKEPEPTEKE